MHNDENMPTIPPETSSALSVFVREGETKASALARAALAPEYQAYLSIHTLNSKLGVFKDTDVTELVKQLEKQAEQLRRDDLTHAEAILAAQAATLDTLFNHLVCRAGLNMGAGYESGREYARLALKAQSQCRETIAKLVDVKRPPVFKQTNIAHGHQQVNNHPTEKPPNELLEEKA